MTKTSLPTFACYRHRELAGYVAAVSHAKAARKAERLYGVGVSVELCLDRKPRPSDRIAANERHACNRAVRYPTDGFEARRAALIAEFKAR